MKTKKTAPKLTPKSFRLFPLDVAQLDQQISAAAPSAHSPSPGHLVPQSILQEAASLTTGARHADYGSPTDNHGCTAKLWSAFLSRKLRTRIHLTAEDVCLLNILQKCSREAHRPKRDNLVDIAGYAANADTIAQDESERIRDILTDAMARQPRRKIARKGTPLSDF